MSQRGKRKKTVSGRVQGEFLHKTISIPGDLVDFFSRQVNSDRHAGNSSSYIRSLIIEDKEKKAAA